jgi:hypothetical protein|tara:strand:+ start:161 stop:352 length:192 start_codon:yes stop_codon:yes gene_type:complete
MAEINFLAQGLKLPAVKLRGIFSVEYDFILSSLANPAAALYATIKDKATTALAKHFLTVFSGV